MTDSRKSFGEELSRVRQERGVGLEELARATKIRPSLLQALEAGRFEVLPPAVFVVGYLQAVARHLGVKAEPLVERYRRLVGAEPPPVREPETPQEEVRPAGKRGPWILLALLAVLAAGALLFWFVKERRTVSGSGAAGQAAVASGPEGESGPVAGPSAGVESVPAPPAPAPPSEAAGQSRTEGSPQGAQATVGGEPAVLPAVEAQKPEQASPSESTASPAPQAQPQSAAAAPPKREAPAEAKAAPASSRAGSGDLVLEFSAPCWAEVWSGDRRVLYRQVAPGESIALKGDSFRATFGDAAAVRATFKGRPVPLPSGEGKVVKDLAIPAQARPQGAAP